MNTIPSLLSRTTSLIKSMLLMTLLLILILTCSACSKLKDTNDTLRLYLESDPITLDPALITDVRSGRLSALIYNNLFKYDYDLRLKPDLVESWSISPDHLLYSFTLKDSVYFSSGKKLSTADIQYTFYRLLDKKTRSPRAWILYHIEGAKDYRDGKTDHISGLILKDSLHFSIRLEKPYSPFLSLLTMPNAAIIPSGNNSTDFSEHPVGTGPFILTFWKHDYEIFFTSNIHYFSGSPKTRSISYKIIKEPLFVSSEFRRGRIDIMQIPGPELPLYRNDPSYAENIKVQNELNVYYMGFNCQNIPFSHLETRQAIIYGIDKEILINTLRKDRVIMLNSPIPQGIPGYDNSAPKHQFAPSKTKKIINQYSPNAPFSFNLLIPFNSETLEIAESIQALLSQSGVNMNIQQLEWSAFKGRLTDGNFDAFILSWWADYPDGENFLYPLFHSSNIGSGGNYTGYNNETVDDLINRSQSIYKTDDRNELFHKIQLNIINDAPMFFLYQSKSYTVTQAWVEGYSPHPLYNGNNMSDVAIVRKIKNS